jgi:predicted RNase H-like HicB family nuclease
MLQSRIEIYDTSKLQYRVCFHAVRGGYIVTVPTLEELAVFGTNMKQARIAAATAIEALTEDLEANGVPVATSDPLSVSMTENIERMIRLLSGRPELMDGSIASAPFSPCRPMRRTG